MFTFRDVTAVDSTALRITWNEFISLGAFIYCVQTITREVRNIVNTVPNGAQSIEVIDLFPYNMYEVTLSASYSDSGSLDAICLQQFFRG